MFKNKLSEIEKLDEEYSKIGYISDFLRAEINRLYEDKNYVIGIHRIGNINTGDINSYLSDVFYNGLRNYGDINLGINSKDSNRTLEKTVTFITNPVIMHGQLKAAKNYKNSSGTIIVKIPRSYLINTGEEVKPIYFPDNDCNILLGEYVYGYVSVDDNYVLGNLIKNPNYKDIHDYKPNGLVYEYGIGVEEERSKRK